MKESHTSVYPTHTFSHFYTSLCHQLGEAYITPHTSLRAAAHTATHTTTHTATHTATPTATHTATYTAKHTSTRTATHTATLAGRIQKRRTAAC